jgi:hypothetical protein
MNVERMRDLFDKLQSGEPLPNGREWDYSNPRCDAMAFMPDARYIYPAPEMYREAMRLLELNEDDARHIFCNEQADHQRVEREHVANWIRDVFKRLGVDTGEEQAVSNPAVQLRELYKPIAAATDLTIDEEAFASAAARCEEEVPVPWPLPEFVDPKFPGPYPAAFSPVPEGGFSMDNITVDGETVTVGQMAAAWREWVKMPVDDRTTGQLAFYLSSNGVKHSTVGKYDGPAYKAAEKLVQKARKANVVSAGRRGQKSIWMLPHERNS